MIKMTKELFKQIKPLKNDKKVISANVYLYQRKLIDEYIEQGVYKSKSQIIRNALDLFFRDEFYNAIRKKENIQQIVKRIKGVS